MKRLLAAIAAIAAVLLTCAPVAAQNVATLPLAQPLTGPERIPGQQGSGCPTKAQPCATVAVTPAQLATYLTGTFQAKDGDLDAIAGLTGVDVIYYRSAANTWSPVTIGANLSFSGGTLSTAAGSTGTVTSVSVTTANGVSGTVATATSTPAITLALGAITPSSVASTGTIAGTNITSAGNTTGNAVTATSLATARTLAITGDLAWTSPAFNGSGNVTAAGILATVNGDVGTFGGATGVPRVTVNGKGLITAASSAVLGIAGGGTGRTTGRPMLIAARASANASTAFQSLSGSVFTTIQINAASVDSAGGFNTTTYQYTVPETGTYIVTGKIKLVDNSAAGISWSIGLDTSNSDGPANLWNTTINSSGAYSRNNAISTRLMTMTAGAALRLFAYNDSATALGIASAEISAVLVQ